MSNQSASKPGERPGVRMQLFGCAVIGLLTMGNVQAQWRVIDNDANRKLQDANNELRDANNKLDDANDHLQEIRNDLGEDNGNVNQNLVNLYDQQMIGVHESVGEIAKDPTEVLDNDKPMGATMDDIGIEQRCPPVAAEGIAQQQWLLCRLLVQTELAQYKYSLKMYQTAKDRYQRLETIQNERSNIESEEQGKLQDNNNKLLALLSLLAIDRQQQKTYMDAYAARLNYLRAARDTLTQQALNGRRNSASLFDAVGGAVAGGSTLSAVLEALRTEKKDWRGGRP